MSAAFEPELTPSERRVKADLWNPATAAIEAGGFPTELLIALSQEIDAGNVRDFVIDDWRERDAASAWSSINDLGSKIDERLAIAVFGSRR